MISRPLRIVGAHAAEPEAVFLRAVEDGKLLLLDELVALGGAEAQRVAVAFEREKELGAVIVFPCAGVHGAAPQADDDGQMLDADRALEFAGAAGGALEGGFLRDVLAEQRLFGVRAEFVQVAAHAEDDFFGIENFAGVVGGAVLGAAAAFDAGVGLQGDELGDVFAGDEAEIFVAGERRDVAEAAAREKDGDRAEHQVQMLGVRNQRQKDQERERVRPPEAACQRAAVS